MCRSAICLAAVFLLRSPAGRADEATPDLKPLTAKVRLLVHKHYPKATVQLDGDTIRFEANTRKYMIHEADLTGEWQDAREEVGPRKGGIWGEIEYRPGQYGGMAVVPQTFDKLYFKLLLTAPHSKKLDAHLHILLKYPRDIPKGFFEEFERLTNGFDAYVATTK